MKQKIKAIVDAPARDRSFRPMPPIEQITALLPKSAKRHMQHKPFKKDWGVLKEEHESLTE